MKTTNSRHCLDILMIDLVTESASSFLSFPSYSYIHNGKLMAASSNLTILHWFFDHFSSLMCPSCKSNNMSVWLVVARPLCRFYLYIFFLYGWHFLSVSFSMLCFAWRVTVWLKLIRKSLKKLFIKWNYWIFWLCLTVDHTHNHFIFVIPLLFNSFSLFLCLSLCAFAFLHQPFWFGNEHKKEGVIPFFKHSFLLCGIFSKRISGTDKFSCINYS